MVPDSRRKIVALGGGLAKAGHSLALKSLKSRIRLRGGKIPAVQYSPAKRARARIESPITPASGDTFGDTLYRTLLRFSAACCNSLQFH